MRKFLCITYDGGLLQVKKFCLYIFFQTLKKKKKFPGGSDRSPLLPPAGAHALASVLAGVAYVQSDTGHSIDSIIDKFITICFNFNVLI